jgi:hypothetical protein
MRVAFASLLLLTASSARATPPCVGATTELSVPAFGAVDVPINVTPFVAGASQLPRLVDDAGLDVPINVDRMAIIDAGDGPDGEVLRLLPLAPLEAGRAYRVVEGTRDVTTFTTAPGDVVDDEAPLAPEAIMPERYYDNCGATQLEIPDGERDRIGAALFIVAATAPSIEDEAEWMGAGEFEESVLVHGALHRATLQVAAVDLAGNVSESTPVDVRLPPASCMGCSSSGVDGAPALFALFALCSLLFPSRRARRRASVLLVALLAATGTNATPPCDGALNEAFIVPMRGSVDVPTNVTPFVASPQSLPRLVRDDDVDVALNADVFAVHGGVAGDADVYRLLPATPLDSGRTYRIVVSGREDSSFTVGDGPDVDAPSAPEASMPATSFSDCYAPTLAHSSEEGSIVVVTADTLALADGERWHGVGRSDYDAVIVHEVEDGSLLQVRAVDQAGNVSGATEVEVVREPDAQGCSSASHAPAAVVLLLLVLRRRRLALRFETPADRV